jgi:hypothetical protein
MPYLKVDFASAEATAATLKQNAADRTSDITTLSSRVDPSGAPQ